MPFNKSYLEYLIEIGIIYKRHREVYPDKDPEGERIARIIGVKYDGWWEELKKFQFTDINDTGSSFSASDLDEARRKLKDMRMKFAMAVA